MKNDGRYGSETYGDVDVDFVAMMVPHHQGATDMAIAVPVRSQPANQAARPEIIVTQQQEIAAMAGGPAAATGCACADQVPPAGQIDPQVSRPAHLMKEP
jgi:uncharacterized protein (DUF305 family)